MGGMRKALIGGLMAMLAVVLAIAFYRHFRIVAIDAERPVRSAAVTDVAARECRPELNLSDDRAVILYAGPNVSWVTINGEYVVMPELQQRLDDILRTRIHRIVYVLDFQDSDSLVLEKIVAQMPEVSRLCVMDSRHLPAWYPRKRKPVSGGSGGLVALALRRQWRRFF
jgi:hypothetical protein